MFYPGRDRPFHYENKRNPHHQHGAGHASCHAGQQSLDEDYGVESVFSAAFSAVFHSRFFIRFFRFICLPVPVRLIRAG